MHNKSLDMEHVGQHLTFWIREEGSRPGSGCTRFIGHCYSAGCEMRIAEFLNLPACHVTQTHAAKGTCEARVTQQPCFSSALALISSFPPSHFPSAAAAMQARWEVLCPQCYFLRLWDEGESGTDIRISVTELDFFFWRGKWSNLSSLEILFLCVAPKNFSISFFSGGGGFEGI